ncbi:seminase-like [Drosophila elegans]|uniref:seminase-like n=1 Tax=Drosophila elegans TaxID=30023 RepID=UPI0007E6A92D|nr:seminase-like [Drosophila elegans]
MNSLLVYCILSTALYSVHVLGLDINEIIDVEKLAKIVLPSAQEARVIGGQVTTNSKLGGYLVALLYERDFVCGGTLLHELIVLTAAHCFLDRMRTSDWIVVGGISRLDQRGIRRQVKNFIISDKFEEDNMDMDVAVMLLKRPMKGRGIGKLELCSTILKPGNDLIVSGWGLTVATGSGPQKLLRTVTVPVINKKNCRSAYQPLAKITDNMICAAVLGKKDACTFDSGGPLVYKKQVCGIVSFGIGCASKRYPGVYTDVFNVKEFIENSTKVLLSKC